MNTLPSNTSEDRLPAGAEFMHETPRVALGVGELACIMALGSDNADDEDTLGSMDPDTMDPFVGDRITEFAPDNDIVNLN